MLGVISAKPTPKRRTGHSATQTQAIRARKKSNLPQVFATPSSDTPLFFSRLAGSPPGIVIKADFHTPEPLLQHEKKSSCDKGSGAFCQGGCCKSPPQIMSVVLWSAFCRLYLIIPAKTFYINYVNIQSNYVKINDFHSYSLQNICIFASELRNSIDFSPDRLSWKNP